MKRLDPRTKLALGIILIALLLIAHRPETLIVSGIIILLALFLLGKTTVLIRSLRLIGPMVGLVFIIAFISFDLRLAVLLALRLFNLLTVSLVFFRSISPDELGDALKNLKLPFEFIFILTTGMRYVPLLGQKVRLIIDAQQSRGIDLGPRLKNIVNFMALMMPLLVQAFILSDDLAMAMECRGFNCKGRSSRKQYHLTRHDYLLLALSLLFFVAFTWWERFRGG